MDLVNLKYGKNIALELNKNDIINDIGKSDRKIYISYLIFYEIQHIISNYYSTKNNIKINDFQMNYDKDYEDKVQISGIGIGNNSIILNQFRKLLPIDSKIEFEKDENFCKAISILDILNTKILNFIKNSINNDKPQKNSLLVSILSPAFHENIKNSGNSFHEQISNIIHDNQELQETSNKLKNKHKNIILIF